MTPSLPNSLLVDPMRHPLCPEETVRELGSTVVVAPHPDDESLGCGGLLALLAVSGQPAHIVVMTDGSRSHPNSQTHPASRLAALREEEAIAAAAALGWPAEAVHFLRFADCGLPAEGTGAYDEAVLCIRQKIELLAPDTLFVPWRRDPHGDHEATWRLMRAAVGGLATRPRWLEYPIWAWPQAEGEVAPRSDEGRAWRLDITSALHRKQEAIMRHRSQMGAIIHDDPTGFVLKPEMLAYFMPPWELFLEPTDV